MPDLPIPEYFISQLENNSEDLTDDSNDDSTDDNIDFNRVFIETYECKTDFSFINDDRFIIVREWFIFLDSFSTNSVQRIYFESNRWFVPISLLITFVSFLDTRRLTYTIIENACTCLG